MLPYIKNKERRNLTKQKQIEYRIAKTIKMVAEAVKVIVRCRPMNKREKDLKCKVNNSKKLYFYQDHLYISTFEISLNIHYYSIARGVYGLKDISVLNSERKRHNGSSKNHDIRWSLPHRFHY